MHLAVFITDHGFGHAARTCAILESLNPLVPELSVTLVSAVPTWFFDESLTFPFTHICEQVDVGFMQTDAFNEQPRETVQALASGKPYSERYLALTCQKLSTDIDFLITDVTPLAFQVAQRMGKPIVLVENFTWDWIYGHYLNVEPALRSFCDLFAHNYAHVDRHYQTEPICKPIANAIQVQPVSRRPRTPPSITRQRLGLNDDQRIVLVSLGVLGRKSNSRHLTMSF